MTASAVGDIFGTGLDGAGLGCCVLEGGTGALRMALGDVFCMGGSLLAEVGVPVPLGPVFGVVSSCAAGAVFGVPGASCCGD